MNKTKQIEKNFMIIGEVWYDSSLKHIDKIIHAYMRGQYIYFLAVGDKGYYNESVSTIAEQCNTNRHAVHKSLTRLENAGYLERKTNFGESSKYIFHDERVDSDLALARDKLRKTAKKGVYCTTSSVFEEPEEIPF